MDTPDSSRFPETHLTDEQFTDLLLGSIAPQVAAHLDLCPQCAREAERVSGAIVSFGQQSSLWAERRAATAPLVQPSQRPVSWMERPAGRVAWSAAAAAVVLAAAIGLVHKKSESRGTVQPTVAVVQPVPQQVSPASVKANNELMLAIDGELQAEVTPPASVYGLDEETHVARHKATKKAAN